MFPAMQCDVIQQGAALACQATAKHAFMVDVYLKIVTTKDDILATMETSQSCKNMSVNITKQCAAFCNLNAFKHEKCVLDVPDRSLCYWYMEQQTPY